MPTRPLRARWVLVALALSLLAGACASGDAGSFARSQPSTSAYPTTIAAAPTTAGTLPVATTASCPAIPARAVPDPARPTYTLTLDVRPDQGTVDGRQQVRFTPDMDTDRLVLRLWPNGLAGAATAAVVPLVVGPVTVGGRPADATLDDATTMSVRTGATVRARQPVDIAMTWRLVIPGPANDRVSRNGDALRLGSFFPILPWEPGVGWDTEPPAGTFAEASTAPTADFDLTVAVPDGYDVLASGTPDPARTGHYTAVAMRDVALSVGRFQTASGVAMAP